MAKAPKAARPQAGEKDRGEKEEEGAVLFYEGWTQHALCLSRPLPARCFEASLYQHQSDIRLGSVDVATDTD